MSATEATLRREARVHIESLGVGPPLVLLHGFALHGGLLLQSLGLQALFLLNGLMLGAAVVYSLRLVDLVTQEPVPDVVVDACALTDITCNAPVAARLTPDAEGWVNVPLTSNFTGYLEYTIALSRTEPNRRLKRSRT